MKKSAKFQVFQIVIIIFLVISTLSAKGYAQDDQWEIMKHGTGDLYGIWGSSETDVFAAGLFGTIILNYSFNTESYPSPECCGRRRSDYRSDTREESSGKRPERPSFLR